MFTFETHRPGWEDWVNWDFFPVAFWAKLSWVQLETLARKISWSLLQFGNLQFLEWISLNSPRKLMLKMRLKLSLNSITLHWKQRRTLTGSTRSLWNRDSNILSEITGKCCVFRRWNFIKIHKIPDWNWKMSGILPLSTKKCQLDR